MKHLRRFLLFFCAVAGLSAVQAQRVASRLDCLPSADGSLRYRLQVEGVSVEPEGETYARLCVAGDADRSVRVGAPLLPQWNVVVSLPEGARVTWETVEDCVDTLRTTRPLVPAQPSAVKGRLAPFAFDRAVYARRDFYAEPLLRLVELGVMRGRRLVRLCFSPFAYNPSTGVIAVHSRLEVSLTWDAGVAASVASRRSAWASPYFDALDASTQAKAGRGGASDDVPPVYLVVSPESFADALRPLVAWKRQLGLDVEVMLTTPDETRLDVQNRLARRFEEASATRRAPTFVLLVGSLQRMPVSSGTQHVRELGQHLSDLFFADYTGDFLPEVLLGRLSVDDTAQLGAVVRKTIDYERLARFDTTRLNRALLVAGRELGEPAPTVTNAQVNYLKAALQPMDTLCFYNPESENLRPALFEALRQGVGLVNYSGHCIGTGWMHPWLSASDVDDSLPSDRRYFWAVNNCCRSNDFAGYCFGEALLRKPEGGAVGVIGATGETLWDEDFFWATGTRRPYATHPLYDPDAPGAFDRLLHRHGEPEAEQAATLGEMMLYGNLSVARHGSPYADYYWETYALLGDPSLMPYVGMPSTLSLQCADVPTWGLSSLRVQGTPRTTVAAVQDTVLLGVTRIGSDGSAMLQLRRPLSADSLVLTASAQFARPQVVTLPVRRPETACVVAAEWQLTDTSGRPLSAFVAGADCRLMVRWRNGGADTARNLRLTVTQDEADREAGYPLVTADPSAEATALAPDADTVVTYRLHVGRSSAEAVGQLRCRAEADDMEPQERIGLWDVLRPRCEVGLVVLQRDGTSAASLQAGTSYLLQVPVVNRATVPADSVRLALRPLEGVCLEADDTLRRLPSLPADASDTLWIPFSTPDTLSQATLELDLRCEGSFQRQVVTFLAGTAVETFERGHFGSFPWDTLSPYPWTTDTTAPHGGRYAARSGVQGDMQQSDLCITVEVNRRDTLAFWYRTSSEEGQDALVLLIDGREHKRWSGVGQWKRYATPVDPGRHTFCWRFATDDFGSDGDNCAWLDDIRLPFGRLAQETVGYGTSVHVEPSVSASSVEPPTLLRVYPNPAADRCVLQADEPGHLTLYDLYGRRVDDFDVESPMPLQYSLAHLRCGIYSIVFSNARHREVTKLTVAR
ncbi:MAG: hypothetical protein IJ684_02405 [Bacteroidales bacterium]|nr:hypothetical protein [Bacteroidales bacterium]